MILPPLDSPPLSLDPELDSSSCASVESLSLLRVEFQDDHEVVLFDENDIVSSVWLQIPNEVYAEILSFLDLTSIFQFSLVSHRFRALATWDVAWLRFRERVFMFPEGVTQDFYETFVNRQAERFRTKRFLQKRLPWVVVLFLSFFVLMWVDFFLALVSISFLAAMGFRGVVLAVASFVIFGVLVCLLAITVVGLIVGMELWVRKSGIGLSQSYIRLRNEELGEGSERIALAHVPLRRQIGEIPDWVPETSGGNVYAIYICFQLHVWCLAFVPCLALAVLLPFGLKAAWSEFPNYRLTCVSFVVAAFLHEIILWLFGVKFQRSTVGRLRESPGIFGRRSMKRNGIFLIIANWIVKVILLGSLIPTSLIVDGAFSTDLRFPLIPVFAFLLVAWIVLSCLFCRFHWFATKILCGFGCVARASAILFGVSSWCFCMSSFVVCLIVLIPSDFPYQFPPSLIIPFAGIGILMVICVATTSLVCVCALRFAVSN